jgi:hypothetical protein
LHRPILSPNNASGIGPTEDDISPGSTSKLAEHGGFSHDDTNIIMLVSNANIEAKTVTSPLETMQAAPTILQALGLGPQQPAVRRRRGHASASSQIKPAKTKSPGAMKIAPGLLFCLCALYDRMRQARTHLA